MRSITHPQPGHRAASAATHHGHGAPHGWRSRWRRFGLSALVAMPLLGATPLVFGATPATTLPDSPQAMMNALSRAHAAVVGVTVVATEGALSAETLGQRRSGSGVVISADGTVLTIGYLLVEAEQITLVLPNGRSVPATTLAYDVATGFGLVRPLLPLQGVPAAPLGSILDLDPGALVMVATGGAASDVDMTQLVSKRAFSGNWEYHIDAALFTAPPVANHSGAPVFNQRGELVGIGSLLVMDVLGTGRRQPGNMFVPIDLLQPVLAELVRTGSSRPSHRPWLGLNSAESDGKVQVVKVNAESPAQAAGLQAGDVLLTIDGDKVESLEGFYKKLWSRGSPDADVTLTVQQGTEVRTVTLRAVDRMSTMKKPKGV